MAYLGSEADAWRRVRSMGLWAIAATGLPHLALRRKRDRATIVLYHGVTREQGDGIFNYRGKFVDTSSFEAHIRWLRKHFTILPLVELVENLGTRYDKPPLAITFDDGYANNYTDAFPVLRSTGTPATFFITSGFIEGTPLAVDRLEYALGGDVASISVQLPETITLPLTTRSERLAADNLIRAKLKRFTLQEREDFISALVVATGRDLAPILRESSYAPMTWDQMQEMHAAGMAFAAHTVTHPIVARLSSKDASDEIRRSHDALAAHGLAPIPVFAYPNGGTNDFSDETIAILRENGFTAALTTKPGDCGLSNDRFRLPRYTLDGADEIYRVSMLVSGVRRMLQRE